MVYSLNVVVVDNSFLIDSSMGKQGSLAAGGAVVVDPVEEGSELDPPAGWAVDTGLLFLMQFIISLVS